jgi:ZIP family zinc transporter
METGPEGVVRTTLDRQVSAVGGWTVTWDAGRAVAEAFAWGLLASSSLLVGAIVALTVRVGTRALGMVMAFGSGVLISAVAYELALEAFETGGGSGYAAGGLAAGSLAFFAGDTLIGRFGGSERKRSGGCQASGTALAIVLGIVLDGIPESAVIGLSLLSDEGVTAAVIVAVFLSNLPESIAATTGLAASGWPRARIFGLWVVVAAVSGVAALAGYALLDGASSQTLAFVLAFAGGAILTMLADTMMPEAFEHGGRVVGLFTTLGFCVAFAISALE